jgi:hypothetical protein
MLGHSRSKNGVASLAYVPGIHVLRPLSEKDVDGRHRPGHDEPKSEFRRSRAMQPSRQAISNERA